MEKKYLCESRPNLSRSPRAIAFLKIARSTFALLPAGGSSRANNAAEDVARPASSLYLFLLLPIFSLYSPFRFDRSFMIRLSARPSRDVSFFLLFRLLPFLLTAVRFHRVVSKRRHRRPSLFVFFSFSSPRPSTLQEERRRFAHRYNLLSVRVCVRACRYAKREKG